MPRKRVSSDLFWVALFCLHASPAAVAEGSRQQAAEVIVPEAARPWYEQDAYAPAVKIGNAIYLSGIVFTLEGTGSYSERYAAGFRSAMRRIEEVLMEAGASLDDVIDFTSYHTDMSAQLETALQVRKEAFAPPYPTWTAVGVSELALPNGVSEIKVIAHVGE